MWMLLHYLILSSSKQDHIVECKENITHKDCEIKKNYFHFFGTKDIKQNSLFINLWKNKISTSVTGSSLTLQETSTFWNQNRHQGSAFVLQYFHPLATCCGIRCAMFELPPDWQGFTKFLSKPLWIVNSMQAYD